MKTPEEPQDAADNTQSTSADTSSQEQQEALKQPEAPASPDEPAVSEAAELKDVPAPRAAEQAEPAADPIPPAQERASTGGAAEPVVDVEQAVPATVPASAAAAAQVPDDAADGSAETPEQESATEPEPGAVADLAADVELVPSAEAEPAAGAAIAVATTATAADRRKQRREDVARNGARNGARRGGAGRAALAIVTGTLLVAGTAAAAVASQNWSTPSTELPIEAASMAAGDTVVACAPTPRLVGGSAGTDSAYAPGAAAASSTLRALAVGDNAQRVPGATLLSGDRTLATLSPRLDEAEAAKPATAASDGFSGVKAAVLAEQSGNDASWLRAQSLGGLRSLAALTRTVSQGSGDLTGLAVQSCAAPAHQTWLSGASTTLGHTAVLVVSNPSKTTANVSVSVRTTKGVAVEGAVQDFTLEPGASKSLNLGGAARDEAAVALKVSSTGAPVSASVAQHVLRGLTPGGIDLISGSALPSTSAVMPGVVLQNPADSTKVGVSESAGDEVPQVQIADASGAASTVSLYALSETGQRTDVATDQSLPANGTLALDLTKLPAGVYTLVAEGSDSLVATARTLRGTDPKQASDVAYVPAVTELSTDQLLALPAKGSSVLRLAAPEEASKVLVAPVLKDGTVGSSRTVTIAAGHTVAVPASDFESAVGLRIGATGGTAFAALTVQEGKSGIGATVPQQLPDAPASARVILTP